MKTLKEKQRYFEDLYFNRLNQKFYLRTMEIPPSSSYDISLYDQHGKHVCYLFDISSYSAYEYASFIPDCDTIKSRIISKFYSLSTYATFTPYYFKEHFLVKRYGNITNEDIYQAGKYYFNTILQLYPCNIIIKD